MTTLALVMGLVRARGERSVSTASNGLAQEMETAEIVDV